MGDPTYLQVKRTGARSGQISMTQDAVVCERTFEQPQREGIELDPLDLTEPMSVGVPVPLAGFALPGQAHLVVVLGTLSLEGVMFEVMAQADGKLDTVGSSYVYLCAN